MCGSEGTPFEGSVRLLSSAVLPRLRGAVRTPGGATRGLCGSLCPLAPCTPEGWQGSGQAPAGSQHGGSHFGDTRAYLAASQSRGRWGRACPVGVGVASSLSRHEWEAWDAPGETSGAHQGQLPSLESERGQPPSQAGAHLPRASTPGSGLVLLLLSKSCSRPGERTNLPAAAAAAEAVRERTLVSCGDAGGASAAAVPCELPCAPRPVPGAAPSRLSLYRTCTGCRRGHREPWAGVVRAL